MPRKIDDRVRQLAGDTYAKTDLTLPQIAKKFKVSDRTTQTWSSEDNWDLQRTAHRESNKPQNVVEFARQPREERPLIRSMASSQDPIEIADMIIKDLQGEMAVEGAGREKAAVANALREWVKYRSELLKPKTAADFADQLIASGVSIREFVQLLKERQAASA
jgi:hypothetical protein